MIKAAKAAKAAPKPRIAPTPENILAALERLMAQPADQRVARERELIWVSREGDIQGDYWINIRDYERRRYEERVELELLGALPVGCDFAAGFPTRY